MAEYRLKFTAKEIEEKLEKVDNLTAADVGGGRGKWNGKLCSIYS